MSICEQFSSSCSSSASVSKRSQFYGKGPPQRQSSLVVTPGGDNFSNNNNCLRGEDVGRSIERRWHCLWLRSLEWQCYLEQLTWTPNIKKKVRHNSKLAQDVEVWEKSIYVYILTCCSAINFSDIFLCLRDFVVCIGKKLPFAHNRQMMIACGKVASFLLLLLLLYGSVPISKICVEVEQLKSMPRMKPTLHSKSTLFYMTLPSHPFTHNTAFWILLYLVWVQPFSISYCNAILKCKRLVLALCFKSCLKIFSERFHGFALFYSAKKCAFHFCISDLKIILLSKYFLLDTKHFALKFKIVLYAKYVPIIMGAN